ncbi:MAG: succinyldiaminopimelate transaminase [Bifidobacterium choerinum]
MGFHDFSSPYDWSRIAQYKDRAREFAGGMIDLSIGSPVDDVPEAVRVALADAASAANGYGYPATVGTAELRAALHEWFRDCRDVELAQIGADVVPTVGSKEAVAMMASLLHLGAGDVVVQPRVSYPTYEIGTQVADATVHKVDDVADVASWKDVPGVKAVWVNSPNNPTGATLDAEQLRRIVEAARAIDAVVLSDECYAMMAWNDDNDGEGMLEQDLEGSPCMLRADVCDGDARGILVLYSLSKQSNMAGYRTACIAGDAAIVHDMTNLRKQLGLIVPGPVQAAMTAGLRSTDAVRLQHNRYHARLKALVEGLRAYGYNASMPQGALYVWVKAKSGDCWQDMEDLASIGVIASPGEFYGDGSHLRFSSTVSDEDIAAAVGRLRAAAAVGE